MQHTYFTFRQEGVRTPSIIIGCESALKEGLTRNLVKVRYQRERNERVLRLGRPYMVTWCLWAGSLTLHQCPVD